MKKIISSGLALLFFVLQNNMLIHAMNVENMKKELVSKGDPTDSADVIRYIDATFRGLNPMIADTTLACPADWQNRSEIELVDSSFTDFRRIQVLNIPKLMGKRLDDNFIKYMIELRSVIVEIEEKFDNERQIGEFSKKITKELNERFAKDQMCVRALNEISQKLKIDKDDIANAFIAWGLSDALTGKYTEKAITEFIIAGGMVGVAAAVGAAGWYFGGAIAAKLTISAATVSVATVCGVAVLAIGGIVLAIFAFYALDKADDEAIAKFKLQKYQNLSFLIQQFFETLVMESPKVMKSTVLVAGVDERKFKTSGLFWHLRNKNLPNHGYWCEFKEIKNLPYSPAAEIYRNPQYNRYLAYFIDILKEMEYHKVRKVDFERLREYLNLTFVPKQITLPPMEHRRHLIDTVDPEELLKRKDEFTEEEQEEILLKRADQIRARRQQQSSSGGGN